MDVPLRRSVRCCFGQEDFVGEHTESLRRYIGDKVSSFREKSENCCTDMRVLSQAAPGFVRVSPLRLIWASLVPFRKSVSGAC